jgi:pseudaminic acid synthase
MSTNIESNSGDPSITIAGRRIAWDEPTYIVAELSANHLGDFDRAVELVREAAKAGADAVKLQTYTPDTMTLDLDAPPFRIGEGSLWTGRYLHQLYQEAQTPWDWTPKLRSIAHSCGVELYSTPFDETAVRFLQDMDMPVYKIASFELVDAPLLRLAAQTGKPVILSTGMATLDEIDDAVQTLRSAGALSIALLKCTNNYPARADEMNLRAIQVLSERYKVVAGVSDHTEGPAVAVAAVALGARIVEKHFTLLRSDGGPDSAFSMEPDEFAVMVQEIRATEQALGVPVLMYSPHEAAHRSLRRSLFVVEDMRAGDVFTEQNLKSLRPANGLMPKHLPEILTKTASCDIARGTPLEWRHVQK